MEDGALHVAVTALESVGAVIRVGYGPDALYALNRQCPQTLPCPEGELACISPAVPP